MRRGRDRVARSAAPPARLGRRALLEGVLGCGLSPVVLGGLGAGATGCWAEGDLERADPPGPRWMRYARIAGLDFSDPDADLAPVLDAAVRARVSVIEADSVLSEYASDEVFDLEVRRIDEYARRCQERNLKVLWYYPCLEILSPDGEEPSARSLYEDHPDWVQLNIDHEPNVFHGGEEDGGAASVESAWLCHNSGFRDYFFDRIRKLARTRLDGLWLDVPLFADAVPRWTCLNPACIEKFRTDTGLSAEGLKEDWEDPVFRTWIAWRHEELARFCMETCAVARGVKPGFELVVETVTMDTNIATEQGLDASFRTFALSKPAASSASLVLPERVDRVWEIDSVSNELGMRPGLADDWLCKIRGAKFARGCDRPRSSWAFSYGAEEADSGLVMSVLCATGCNPYEAKTPEMMTSVGVGFRTRMFEFIRKQAELLFDAEPVATVGVLHSSSSRDYIDRGADSAFFVSAVNDTLNRDVHEADPSFFAGASLRDTTYCADYGGTVKALSHLHLPFSIVPLQTITEADEPYLGTFRLLVAPSLQFISDLHAEMLVRFVKAGGHLLVFGQAPGHGDQLGAPKVEAARLDRLLGFDSAKGAASIGGKVTYRPELLGREYLRTEDATALAVFEAAAVEAGAHRVVMDRKQNPHIHVELARHGGRWVLHLVNYGGAPTELALKPGAATGYPFVHDYTIVRRDVAVELLVPGAIKGVTFISPDTQFVAEEARWLGGGKVQTPVFQYTIVVFET